MAHFASRRRLRHIPAKPAASNAAILELPRCWEDFRPHLLPKCREVLAQVALCVASEHEILALTPEQVETMRALAADHLKSV